MVEDSIVFALDIGTRKIIGLVMERLNDNEYRVLASEMIEHSTRAMLDGQIHDVETVAQIIEQIKKALEVKLGMELKSAAVAAAGRSLRTAIGHSVKTRASVKEITREEVRAMEVEAVQQAQYLLSQEIENAQERQLYFCVGYSAISYILEGQVIGNLIGQVGTDIEAKVIATFLPRVVVDGLFSALRLAGLEIFSMTLEPIAALSVSIPQTMRMLNLALVDIGAGTSDIAIVKDGNVYAYAMVPSGGDKITECLASTYLLDFNYAEALKKQIETGDSLKVIDVLGNESVYSAEDLIGELQESIDELAGNIAARIIELNHKSPDAVMCVGGGSLTPNIIKVLSEQLKLPLNRIGIRNTSFNNIKVDADYLDGPQGVTPLGIAYAAFVLSPARFVKVMVNDRELSLWNTQALTISTALLSSGINLTNIYGNPGMGKTLEINGEVKSFRGGVGGPPEIKLNGDNASLESRISQGDRIIFSVGRNGDDARVFVKDIIPSTAQGMIKVNDEWIDIMPLIKVNGAVADRGMEIPDRAEVVYQKVNTIRDILQLAEVPQQLLKTREINYFLNDKPKSYAWEPLILAKDGEIADLNTKISPNCELKYSVNSFKPLIREILQEYTVHDLKVRVNGKNIRISGKGAAIMQDNQPVKPEAELEDGMKISIDTNQSTAILSDVLPYINLSTDVRGQLLIKVNGEEAGFTTPLHNGDVVDIIWQ